MAFFVIFFLAGMLGAPTGKFIMDGASAWPWLVSLPIGVGVGYAVGKRASGVSTKLPSKSSGPRVKTPEPKENASKAVLRCVPDDTYTLTA